MRQNELVNPGQIERAMEGASRRRLIGDSAGIVWRKRLHDRMLGFDVVSRGVTLADPACFQTAVDAP